jgi:hypothetical protein
MVLGPLLTLIAFKSGKPSRKFDLCGIVLLQLGALLYGGMIVYQQRPAFVVFGVDRFTTIPAAEVDFDRIKYPELKRIAGIGLRLAQARPPTRSCVRMSSIFSGFRMECGCCRRRKTGCGWNRHSTRSNKSCAM